MLRRAVVGSAQQVLRSFKPKIQATKPKDTAKMIGDGVVVSCRCASSLFVRRTCASTRCARWMCILSLRLCTWAKELRPLSVVYTSLLNVICTKSWQITDASYQLDTCVPCKRCFLPCAGWLSAQVRVNWNENLLDLSLSLAHLLQYPCPGRSLRRLLPLPRSCCASVLRYTSTPWAKHFNCIDHVGHVSLTLVFFWTPSCIIPCVRINQNLTSTYHHSQNAGYPWRLNHQAHTCRVRVA